MWVGDCWIGWIGGYWHLMWWWGVEFNIKIIYDFIVGFQRSEWNAFWKGVCTVTCSTIWCTKRQVYVFFVLVWVFRQTYINLGSSYRICLNISVRWTLIIWSFTLGIIFSICFITQETPTLHTRPSGSVFADFAFKADSSWTLFAK